MDSAGLSFPKDVWFSKVKILFYSVSILRSRYYFCSGRRNFCLWEQKMRAKCTIWVQMRISSVVLSYWSAVKNNNKKKWRWHGTSSSFPPSLLFSFHILQISFCCYPGHTLTFKNVFLSLWVLFSPTFSFQKTLY